MTTTSAVGNTPINPFKVDTEAHPLVSHVTLWPVTLDRGDVLFIPSQWWHMVLTVPAFEEGLHPADVRNMALTAQFDRGHFPPITSHFSRRRAELYLNIPEEVPTVESLKREGEEEEPLTSMADLKGSEWREAEMERQRAAAAQ